MRTVVKSDEVFHLWAHQTQNHARGSAAISFSGTEAYSYSATIGKIYTNERGEKLFVVSDYDAPYHRNSPTTASHQGMLRRAIPAGETVVQVYHPGDAPAENVERMVAYLPTLIKKVKAARKNGDFYLERLQKRIDDIEIYARFFDLPVPVLPSPTDMAQLDALASQVSEAVTAAREEREAEQRRREEQRLAEAQVKLEQWKAGEIDYVPYLPAAFLRVSPRDPELVETTQGARVPIEDVRRAAPLILRGLKAGKTIEFSSDGPKFGHYQLNAITQAGVRVGCHRFDADEIERFAQVIGVTAA